MWHGLRDDHRLRGEQKAPRSERPGARQQEVDREPDDDGRQSHQRVEDDDHSLAAGKARERDGGAKRHADESAENDGRQTDDECTDSTAMTSLRTATRSPVGLHDAVVIAVARREQGLVVAAGNPFQLSDVAGIAAKRARFALRPQGAGAQLLLLALVARAGLALDALALVRPVCPTGADIAQAVRAGRVDCGIAPRAVAQAAGLGFVPLTWERFDLALRRRDYFLPALQALFKFVRTATFREHASELAGYDVSDAGNVRWVN